MDGEVVESSDTQRYRMAGNGVIPAVIEEILRRLLLDGVK
jgi:site-specific DNA-cytosine methylase